jgi:hypothetical protein
VDLKLSGKIALVTGSTAGIGFAIAKSLASEGAHVYANGRTRERVDAATAVIRSHAAAAKVGGIRSGLFWFSWRSGRDCETPCGGCAGEQCRHFRAQAVCGDSRCGLVPPLRDKRDERSAPLATLSGGNAGTELGPDSFPIERIGVQIPAEMVHYGWCTTE